MSTRRGALSIFYPICGWAPHRVTEVREGETLAQYYYFKENSIPLIQFHSTFDSIFQTGGELDIPSLATILGPISA